MRKLVVFFIAIAVAGCSPQKRLARLLEKHPLPTETVIEVRDTIIYRDTTVFKEIPGEIISDTVQVPIEIELPYMSLKRHSTLAEAEAWVEGRNLGLNLIQYDTLFQFKLDSAIRENSDTLIVTNTVQVPKIIPPKPFYKNGFFILLGLFLVTILLMVWFLTKK